MPSPALPQVFRPSGGVSGLPTPGSAFEDDSLAARFRTADSRGTEPGFIVPKPAGDLGDDDEAPMNELSEGGGAHWDAGTGDDEQEMTTHDVGSRCAPDAYLPQDVARGDRRGYVDRQVCFQTDYNHKKNKRLSRRFRHRVHRLQRTYLQILGLVEAFWRRRIRPLVIFLALFELWSMGIWLGFLTEPEMAPSLLYVAYVDIGCNAWYAADCFMVVLGAFVAKRLELARRHQEEHRHRRGRRNSQRQSEHRGQRQSEHGGPRQSEFGGPRLSEHRGQAPPRAMLPENSTTRDRAINAAGALGAPSWIARSHLGSFSIADMRAFGGVMLSVTMVPLQILLLHMLENRRFDAWQIILVLVARGARVSVSFKECMRLINHQEMEVYVDISMHGTSDSSGNRVRILLKQLLVVVFFGHWFGCLSHAVRKFGALLQEDIRIQPDSTRDYFAKFEDEAMLDFTAGEVFWQSYLLTLYKGFNLNYEDMLPERPVELALEVFGSVCILLMKSYCIGSFFKFHQRRELEVQRFSRLMNVVDRYLELYEMPASLCKVVRSYFRYQQANHRRIRTLEVIAGLPVEVQKKLREVEMLPIVVDRNPILFGQGISHEYCMSLVMKLSPRFLQSGEVVFLQDEVPRELIFLDSGAVSLSRNQVINGRTMEQVMCYIRADRSIDTTAIGASATILGCPRFFSSRVRAGQEAVVLTVSRDEFEELNVIFPEHVDVMLRNVAALHNLDTQGHDLPSGGGNDTDIIDDIREDVRATLVARQEQMNSKLCFASTCGDVKLVKELLSKRVEANTSDYDGRSALHLAASEGMTHVLEVLLEASGDANLQDRWGSTPMQDALKNHFIRSAELIRRFGGRLEFADPAGELCTQASEGNIQRMQLLLDFGLDPNAGDYDRRTALHLSASEGHLPVVTFLTSRKANVNAKDRWNSTPIQDAIRSGFPIVAMHLFKEGAHCDHEFAANQLCDAAAAGNISLIETLITTGADVNDGDYDDRTALHLAAAEGRVLALDYLINTAGALHSPVDRWGSTPLQDAISGGHDVCTQVLVACGADLGPSASGAQRQLVSAACKELGFSQRGGFEAYAQNTASLRRSISLHVNMARRGLARGDVFDVAEAAKLNRAVVHGVIQNLRPLCDSALKFSRLISDFEEGTKNLWQFTKLVKNSSRLMREARFWQEMKRLEAKAAANANDSKSMSKDAKDMVFHQTFLRGMRLSSGLATFRIGIVKRLLARIGQLHREHALRSSSRAARTKLKEVTLSKLVAQEVLSELGLREEGEESFDGDDAKKLRHAGITRNKAFTVDEFTSRIEGLARLLLKGEHLSSTIISGPLAVPGVTSGATIAPGHGSSTSGDAALKTPIAFRQTSTALDPVAKWLERRSAIEIEGETEDAGMAPGAPVEVQQQDFFGSMWAPFSRFNADFIEELVDACDVIDPEVVRARTVAAELALLAMSALALDGWDRDVKFGGHGLPDVGQPTRQLHHELMGTSYDDASRSVSVARLESEDWLELGRLCRQTALKLRGPSVTSLEKQKEMLRATRQKHRDAQNVGGGDAADEKHREDDAQERHQGVLSGEEEDDGDEDLEQLPIRVAKILVLDRRVSTDELAVLVDVADEWAEDVRDDQSKVFGEISRERFVMNMVRCITDHDEVQSERIDELHQSQSRRLEREEEEFIGSAVALPEKGKTVPIILSPEEEAQLLEEAARLQEEFSNESGSDAEQNAMAGLALYEFGGGAPPNLGLHTGSGLGNANQVEKTRWWHLQRVLCCFCRHLSKDGRKRRRIARITRRFRELDDDGDGIGTAEMSQLLAVAFNHSLGTEGELRYAYRMFELLEKADVGDLVQLHELLKVLPKLEEEIADHQRKQRRTAADGDTSGNTWFLTRIASRLIVPQDSKWLLWWDRIRSVVVLYYVIEVPIRVCFLSLSHMDAEADEAWQNANTVADVAMAVNVILTFFRAFVSDTGGVVATFYDIRTHYVFGYFAWDVIACCPLDIVLQAETDGQGILARPSAVFRLLRLLHMRHLFGKKSSATLSEDTTNGFYKAAGSMIAFIVTLSHFLACMWWMLGTRYDDFNPEKVFNATHPFVKDSELNEGRGSWTFAYLHRPGEAPIGESSGVTPFWWQYLVCFYWSAGRITLQSSPGNLFGASWVELSWTCVLFLINVAVNGYCDGILVDKVIAGDEDLIEAKAMVRIVEEYVQSADLPDDLVKDIKKSAAQCGRAAERDRMEKTICALPHSLKQRIAKRVLVPKFHLDIFKACSEAFLTEIGAHCRILMFDKNQPLTTVGAPADLLVVLIDGRLTIQGEAGEHIAETASPNEIVGEMPFIFDLKHVVSLVTAEESRIMLLTKADFRSICKLYPQDSISLKRAAMKAIQMSSGETGADDERSLAQSRSPSRVSRTIKKQVSKAKSTMSFRSMSSASSSSQSTTVSDALRRMYAGDLNAVVKRLKDDEEVSRQDIICSFIQQAADGDIHAVEQILGRGEIGVNVADYDQRTALHLATCNGHMKLVECLVEVHKASIHARDRFHNTPIDDAVREKHVKLVKYLAALGAKCQVSGDMAAVLCQAAASGDVETLRLYVEYVGVDPNIGDYDKRTALHLGASEGHLAVVRLLAGLSSINLSPLDRLGFTPLDDAMRHKHSGVAAFLIEQGARMGDQPLGVMLCDLASQGDLAQIKEMVQSDVDLSEADYDARSALHLAASNNHLPIAAYLVREVGIDPNPLDRFLSTPLDDAIRHGHKAMQTFLLDNGGLRGSDQRMAAAVQSFKRWRADSEAQRTQDSLDKERKTTEAFVIQEKLTTILESDGLEDNIHIFTSNSAQWRCVLLELIHNSMTGNPEKDVEEDEAQSDIDAAYASTKTRREEWLHNLAAEIDDVGNRLTYTLESEVVPWLNGLSKAEEKLLNLFVPDVKPAAKRIVEQMKNRPRLLKFGQLLWRASGSSGDGGKHECVPVGLLLQRAIKSRAFDDIRHARLEALSLVQLPMPSRPSAVGLADAATDPPVAGEIMKGGGIDAGPRRSPEDRQYRRRPGTSKVSTALRMLLEDECERAH